MSASLAAHDVVLPKPFAGAGRKREGNSADTAASRHSLVARARFRRAAYSKQ
jgi:hypothetical protein